MVLSKFSLSSQVLKRVLYLCFLITGIISIFFYGIWEGIDSWKVFIAVPFFGYGSISLAIQMSNRSNAERVLCETQERSYVWDFILKNVLLSISFWSVLSVSGAFLFIQYKVYVPDAVLFVQVCILLAVSEVLSIFGIAPHNPRC